MDLFDLNGQLALVTGGNKGIGRSMSIGLAEAGADIIVVCSSPVENLSDLRAEILALGRKFYAYQADLSRREQIYELIHQLETDAHEIGILVNNAGIIMRAPAAEHPDEYWDSVLSVNLDAPFLLARALGKKMIGRGKGKIIFTCSLLSFQGGINVPGYAASKGALSSLIKALSNEWAAKGLQVNGIAPGYVATDNTETLRNDESRSKSILDRIPQGRWGVPDDFKGPVVFLASAAGNYVNGTILTVDGGWMGR